MAFKLHERDLRGKTKIGWLDSRHTFSFGDFRDPMRMGFGPLRVINDDVIIPGAGFGTHPHKDMEIITYMIDGALEHKDSMGNGSVIRPGEIQKMSAGSGVTHSEFNHSKEDSAHLLQIWIQPDQKGLPPAYEQKSVDYDAASKGFIVIGDRDGSQGGVTIHQDVKLLLARPAAEQDLAYDFAPGRRGFLQLVKGQLAIDGETVRQGDGLEISGIKRLDLKAQEDSEILLFDLP